MIPCFLKCPSSYIAWIQPHLLPTHLFHSIAGRRHRECSLPQGVAQQLESTVAKTPSALGCGVRRTCTQTLSEWPQASHSPSWASSSTENRADSRLQGHCLSYNKLELLVGFFLFRCIYSFKRQNDKERRRDTERSCILWFTLPNGCRSQDLASQSQEPGTPGLPCG